MIARSITRKSVRRLLGELLQAKAHVVAPVLVGEGRLAHTEFRSLRTPDEIALHGQLPRNSIKGAFLPPSEILFQYDLKKHDVKLREALVEYPSTVVFGAHPCDAAAVEIIDRVMNWDYRDDPWNGHRKATTMVTFTCDGGGADCFCTVMGLGPDATHGSDLMFTRIGEGFHVESLTTKGEALITDHSACFDDPKSSEAEVSLVKRVARTKAAQNATLDTQRLQNWLTTNFSHDCWSSVALRCHGCGVCASVCPTCHCFDIVDEMAGLDRGVRRRNWDTCQSPKFTAHASGHNPRLDQNARFRQRIMHKFGIYPSKFGKTLCTGCGRCARSCPSGMNLREVLENMDCLAQGAQ